MAWYNTYRPSKFEDVSGQTIVKSVLQNALAHNKVKHGYLLSGPKGTGKTTLARIFANNLNDLEHNPQASMDIIELDAASNSGVDNIRNLIESAKTAPFAGAYKVYIIDEVHMLSKSAMNALLKILEEPPQYLVFLLATTNPEKLLPTVLSRLTKLTLTSHTLEDIIDRLKYICETEKMIIDQPSLELIAKRAGGGQRDAINILETLYSYGLEKYNIADTTNLLGLLPIELLSEISQVFIVQDFPTIRAMIIKVEKVGLDGESFMGQLLGYLLEQSFEVGNDFDSLIIPIAEILDFRLPINTIAASFALIQAKLKEKGVVSQSVQSTQVEQKKNSNLEKPQNLSCHSELDSESKEGREFETVEVSIDQKIVASISNSSIFKHQSGSTSNPPNKILKQDQDDRSGDFNYNLDIQDDKLGDVISNPNLQQIQSIIHSFTKSPLCVMMFKILIPQIIVEEIKYKVITISLTAPTFISQLENAKNQKLILDHIFEQTNIAYRLELTSRSIGGSPLKDHRTEKEILDSKIQAEDKNNRYEAPKPAYGKAAYTGPTRQAHQSPSLIKPEEPENIEHTKSNKLSTKPIEKYFYSVYQGLPAETVGGDHEKSQVPVRYEAIEIPAKAEVILSDNLSWGAEVDELFDF